MIAIIIPYFQRTEGLLRKAVASILKQRFAGGIRIIAIDDGSPVDPRVEMEELAGALGDRFQILRQANGGPGSARNRGIDSLGGDVDIVTFLDSDDEWEQGHLARIQAAFGAGADFYFSDHQRAGSSLARFAETGFDSMAHAPIAGTEDMYWFQGDFFDLLLRGAPVGTSTVAYNFRAMPSLRFNTSVWVGEDILFWMMASRSSRKIAFSRTQGARYGTGVNIYAGATWGTVAGMERGLNAMCFHQHIPSAFPLNAGQKKWNNAFLREIDIDFVSSILASVWNNIPGWKAIALKYFRVRPKAIYMFPMAIARLMKQKIHHSVRSDRRLKSPRER